MREKDLPFDRSKHAIYSKKAKKCVQTLLRRYYDEPTAAQLWEKAQLQYCAFLEDEPALGGVKTDYKYILSYLQTVGKALNLDVQFICYDPHNASAFLTDLDALGYDSVAITQSAKALNDATVDFRLEIESGNVEHDGNEMMTWSIANAKTVSNSFGEIKIDKEYQTERIDPVDAVIDAWTMAMKGEVKPDVNESVEMWLKMYESSRARKTERG